MNALLRRVIPSNVVPAGAGIDACRYPRGTYYPVVIPAKAGIHLWTPAFAGVTEWLRGNDESGLRRADLRLISKRFQTVFRRSTGQATTEVVLLMPLFMFFLYAFAKIFAMLLLVQKLEIASYYAARRWQLESHRNVQYVPKDFSILLPDITRRVNHYLGLDVTVGGPLYATSVASFLGIQGMAEVDVQPTAVWQIVTLRVNTKPIQMALIQTKPFKLEVRKYVPNRDRPIAFVLPGLKE